MDEQNAGHRRRSSRRTTRLRLRPPRRPTPQRRPISTYGPVLHIALLAALTAASVTGGWWLYPDADAEPTLPGPAVVEVPPTTADASAGSGITLDSVMWEEVHAGNGPIPVSDSLARQAPPSETTVRVAVSVSYVGTQTADVPITFIVDLPGEADFLGCATDVKAQLSCNAMGPTPNNMFSEQQKRVTVTGLLRSDPNDPTLPKRRSIGAVLDLNQVSGIAFATSRTRIAAQIPNVMYTALPPQAGPLDYLPVLAFPESSPDLFYVPGTHDPFTTFTNIFIPDPKGIRWAEPPDATGSNMPSLVGWVDGARGDGTAGHHLPLNGVRDSVLRSDSEKTFWSGIALGVAGAGAMGLLQAVLSAILERFSRRRNDSESSVIDTARKPNLSRRRPSAPSRHRPHGRGPERY